MTMTLAERFDSGPIKKSFAKCEHSFIVLDTYDDRPRAEIDVDTRSSTLVCQRCLLTVSRKEVEELNGTYKGKFG